MVRPHQPAARICGARTPGTTNFRPCRPSPPARSNRTTGPESGMSGGGANFGAGMIFPNPPTRALYTRRPCWSSPGVPATIRRSGSSPRSVGCRERPHDLAARIDHEHGEQHWINEQRRVAVPRDEPASRRAVCVAVAAVVRYDREMRERQSRTAADGGRCCRSPAHARRAARAPATRLPSTRRTMPTRARAAARAAVFARPPSWSRRRA